MKLDVLAIGAHPDDVEISCGATVAKLTREGKKVGVLDLTRGELGSRGSADLRDKEAERSGEILGLSARENLAMPDGFFDYTRENQMAIIEKVRKYRPEIILANAVSDRHPDHGKGARLVSDAVFLSGLLKIETQDGGVDQERWRPRAVYHYIQDYYHEPDFVIDVSETWQVKMDAIKAFSSQFYDPNSSEPETPISGKEFFDFLESRARQYGRAINADLAEGFTVQRTPGVRDLFDLI